MMHNGHSMIPKAGCPAIFGIKLGLILGTKKENFYEKNLALKLGIL